MRFAAVAVHSMVKMPFLPVWYVSDQLLTLICVLFQSDGSILAWDLRESDRLHSLSIPWKDGSEMALRSATYDTVYLRAIGQQQLIDTDQRSTPICAIQVIIDNEDDDDNKT
jgi:hypothetical protein